MAIRDIFNFAASKGDQKTSSGGDPVILKSKSTGEPSQSVFIVMNEVMFSHRALRCLHPHEVFTIFVVPPAEELPDR
jgi:hypothetical protein